MTGYDRDNTNLNYEDIINLPHPVSKRHKPMPVEDRAAQFAPFAALTGHKDRTPGSNRGGGKSYRYAYGIG